MNNIINWIRAGPPEIWAFSNTSPERYGAKSLLFYAVGINDAKQKIENWLQWPYFSWEHNEEENFWEIFNFENATQDKNALKNFRKGYLRRVNDRITDLSDINYEEWDPKTKDPPKESTKDKYKDWLEQRGRPPWSQSPWDGPNSPYTDPRSRYNGKAWNPKEWEE